MLKRKLTLALMWPGTDLCLDQLLNSYCHELQPWHTSHAFGKTFLGENQLYLNKNTEGANPKQWGLKSEKQESMGVITSLTVCSETLVGCSCCWSKTHKFPVGRVGTLEIRLGPLALPQATVTPCPKQWKAVPCGRLSPVWESMCAHYQGMTVSSDSRWRERLCNARPRSENQEDTEIGTDSSSFLLAAPPSTPSLSRLLILCPHPVLFPSLPLLSGTGSWPVSKSFPSSSCQALSCGLLFLCISLWLLAMCSKAVFPFPNAS